MSATENNGHDLLNNNNNQTNKYHVTFEDWNTYLWTMKNTSAPRANDAALVPKRDEESTTYLFLNFFIQVLLMSNKNTAMLYNKCDIYC